MESRQEQLLIRVSAQDLKYTKTVGLITTSVPLKKNYPRLELELTTGWLTEIVPHDNNPNFERRFLIDKDPNFSLGVKVTHCKHVDPIFLGQAFIQLNEILQAPDQILTVPLETQAGKKLAQGTVTITATEIVSCEDFNYAVVKIHGEKLDKVDTFSDSDPYIVFYQIYTGNLIPVYWTEVIKDNLNPKFKKQIIPLRCLCECNIENQFLIRCYDFDVNFGKNSTLIGESKVTFKQLLTNPSVELINQSKSTKKGYKNSGILVFDIVELKQQLMQCLSEEDRT